MCIREERKTFIKHSNRYDQMENKKSPANQENDFELAICAIEAICKTYSVPFDIKISSERSRGGVNDVFPLRGWRITVMGKIFRNMSFIECAREACQFVVNAYKNNKPE